MDTAKLVKKPKGRLTPEKQAAWGAQLDSAAAQLVADLKLPGELYLVRWGGTRKGAGTFYTRPQLTLPTVRRTLEPLVYADDGVREPEDLLALKVCDPAMGSGSFLVAALRVLTAAVVEALHVHGRIEVENGKTRVACALIHAEDRLLPTEGFEERLEVVVRRAVVEHCLYGVDKDPLAVELARVALWVETLDRNLPFTFLDHKLRCGDSLVGTWLDRFRDYPLLAFDRQSPDRKWKGVHHEADVWHEALKAKRAEAIADQVELLGGQLRAFGGTSDEELKQAVDRVRRLYRELRTVPAGRPDERARIWRTRIQTEPALARVREAFDTWCSLWFWPLDRLDAIPLPSQLANPSEEARSVVRALRDSRRFLHWELEFPDVFTEPGAGFHAVVGNPPWEIQKPNSKEFFSNHDPLYRAYGKQEALRVQRALFGSQHIEEQWLAYNGDFKDRANFVKHAAEPFGDAKVADHGGGDLSLARGQDGVRLHKAWRARRARRTGTSDSTHPYRYQGSADLNTYKMFVEVAHALLATGGRAGVLVPASLYSDHGAASIRGLLFDTCTWDLLFGFENREQVFDIHSSFKFCVVVFAKGGQTEELDAAFMRHDLEDLTERRCTIRYPVDLVRRLSPSSLSVIEVRSGQDLDVLAAIYANGIRLDADEEDSWKPTYAREFDMTNDSAHFIGRDEAEAQGYGRTDNETWAAIGAADILPLYEGRMIGQFDHSQKGWVSGKGRSAEWREIAWEDKRIEPQYLIPKALVVTEWTRSWLIQGVGLSRREAARLSTEPAHRDDAVRHREARIAFMDVTAATNTRTMIATVLRGFPCGNSAPVLYLDGLLDAVALCTILNSFVYDWLAKARCGGMHLNWYIVASTSVPRPGAARVLATVGGRLVGSAPGVLSGLHSVGLDALAPATKPDERLRLRCISDAIVAWLYGLTPRQFRWILRDCDHPVDLLKKREFTSRLDPKGFWRVGKDVHPERRHTVLAVAAFDALLGALKEGTRDPSEVILRFLGEGAKSGWQLPTAFQVSELALTRVPPFLSPSRSTCR